MSEEPSLRDSPASSSSPDSSNVCGSNFSRRLMFRRPRVAARDSATGAGALPDGRSRAAASRLTVVGAVFGLTSLAGGTTVLVHCILVLSGNPPDRDSGWSLPGLVPPDRPFAGASRSAFAAAVARLFGFDADTVQLVTSSQPEFRGMYALRLRLPIPVRDAEHWPATPVQLPNV